LLQAGASFRMINPNGKGYESEHDIYNVASIFTQINKVNNQMAMCQQRIDNLEEGIKLYVEGVMDMDFISNSDITTEECVANGTVFKTSTEAF